MGKKAAYGRGHPSFLDYVQMIVAHPNYVGMPDAFTDTGEVQWETPSNRTGGKFKDSHLKRYEWWRAKARQNGIDPNVGKAWISRTAKLIHPTKAKPCKNCGRLLDIRYLYPAQGLLARVRKLPYVDDSFPLDPNEIVTDLVARLVEQVGDRVYADLPRLFATSAIKAPRLPGDADAWTKWIVEVYAPLEPRGMLSPGVMSNPPDRFDGFHSFNRCCRHTADKGRSKANLQSYTTDRRVFEYWVDGDWVAANKLMGLIRSDERLRSVACVNGHPGPCSADHIGPISLGFAHRPQFQFLCRSCNSAKNNRMTLADVRHLLAAEARGDVVASWYCQRLWDLRKRSVTTEEHAGRLSKMLRDNRHTVMHVFNVIAEAGHYGFLTTLLSLAHADREPEFVNLREKDYVTACDAITSTPRTTEYATEQKARRVRVAFTALRDYTAKPARNAMVVTTLASQAELTAALACLAAAGGTRALDESIREAVTSEEPSEAQLRSLVKALPTRLPAEFAQAVGHLHKAAAAVAEKLAGEWDSSRYLRALAEIEEAGGLPD